MIKGKDLMGNMKNDDDERKKFKTNVPQKKMDCFTTFAMTIFLFRNDTTKKKRTMIANNKKWQNGRHCEERKRRSNLEKHLLATNGLLRSGLPRGSQ